VNGSIPQCFVAYGKNRSEPAAMLCHSFSIEIGSHVPCCFVIGNS